MAATKQKRGASRNRPVRKERQPVAWQQWFRYGFGGLVLVSSLALIVWLHQGDSLPIKHVSVGGELVKTNKNDLVAAVTPYVKGSFINVDVANIRQAGEALPWVKQIQVRRIWPDKLHLIVDEHQAVTRWGKEALINASGNVFQPPKATFPKDLVLLEGLDGSSKLMIERLLKIHKQTTDLGLKVSHLKMDQRRAWNVTFTNGMQLLLGRANSEQRLKRFVKVFQTGLQRFQTRIVTVDMRYTNGLAVFWKQGQKPDFYGTV